MSLKYVYLLKVEGGTIDLKTGKEINNNKYFQMQEMADGTFTTEYGRFGCANPAIEPNQPMSGWDKKYKSKTNPKKPGGPYTDITADVAQAKTKTGAKDKQVIHNDPVVVEIIKYLQQAANVAVSETYLVKSESVTQAQVDKAQHCINNLSNSFNKFFDKPQWDITKFNEELKKLFTAIPRKMKTVSENLIKTDTKKDEIRQKIEDEQSFLDSMAGQVVTNAATADADTTTTSTAQKTLLESMGLTPVGVASKAEFEQIKKMLAGNGHRLKNVLKVVNKETQKVYDEAMSKARHKKTELLFHGSRSANWIFILQQGLKIRPSGAVHTGSLLGDAIYFATDADKSLGYTDTGRWVNGRVAGSIFMGVYEVRTGNKFEMRRKAYAINNPKNELFDKGYCSVHAYAGANTGWMDLRKDEITIYNSNQSTIKYLLELKA